MLREVTKKTISSFDLNSGVLPKEYYDKFLAIAQHMHLTGEDLENVDFLEESLRKAKATAQQSINIFQTSKELTGNAIEAIETKDINKLNAVQERFEAVQQEIDTIEKIAFRDPLCGCHNRQWLEYNLLNKEKRFKQDCFFIYLDVNNLKFVNDNFGHKYGDSMLKAFATFVVKYVKGELVRLGGDEFVMVAPLSLYKNVAVINKALSDFRTKLYQKVYGKKEAKVSFRISFAFGISVAKAGMDFEGICAKADEIMYMDKKAFKTLQNLPSR